jgi:hypothetical protein
MKHDGASGRQRHIGLKLHAVSSRLAQAGYPWGAAGFKPVWIKAACGFQLQAGAEWKFTRVTEIIMSVIPVYGRVCRAAR